VDVRITVRHDDFDDDVKEYAARKLEGLSRYYKGTRSLDVIFDGDHLTKSVELKAHLAKGAPVMVSAKHEDAMSAIDIANGKLERVLHRVKEKLEDRRHGKGQRPPAVPLVGEDQPLTDEIPDLNG
jgi:ribosomal subunit interface protein